MQNRKRCHYKVDKADQLEKRDFSSSTIESLTVHWVFHCAAGPVALGMGRRMGRTDHLSLISASGFTGSFSDPVRI